MWENMGQIQAVFALVKKEAGLLFNHSERLIWGLGDLHKQRPCGMGCKKKEN